MPEQSFAVIGAGIIGAAVAREITLRFPGSAVTVLEKEDGPARHQTGHNSGVVHAGLYYAPGSLKSRLCRRGVALLRDFCLDHGVAYEECGKIVVALTPREEPRLRDIFERAVANGVPDVRLVDAGGIREIEPNAVGLMALHSPHTAIVDYAGVTRALLGEVERAGGRVHYAEEVTGIAPRGSGVRVSTTNRQESFDYVVACAGLQSDRVAALAGGDRSPRIVPFFGQYSMLEPDHRDVVNGLVYPVPDPAYPFLGVHLTKRVDGEMLVGPNAFLSFGREGYSGRGISVRDCLDVVSFPGFWRFAGSNVEAAVREARSVLSRRAFIGAAAEYVPAMAGARSRPITRGIRAQAMAVDGTLVEDFVIENRGHTVLVRNAPSPGATSSLAIAEHIVADLAATHGLSPAA